MIPFTSCSRFGASWSWGSIPRSLAVGTGGAALAACCLSACAGGITLAEIETPRPVPRDSCVVIGFLGGRDRWDDAEKGVRRLALDLRYERGIYTETFENRRRDVAESFLVGALDADGDDNVGVEEARDRRVVVYGQSFGGAAVVKLAHRLEELEIPILLTVQVDSVGRNDGTIPANVAHALNLHQTDGLFVEGEKRIRAANSSRTLILGNWRFRYDEPPGSDVALSGVSFWKRLFRVAHAKMDRDPRVWNTVGELVRAACRGDDLETIASELGRLLDVDESPR
ncbi:MAG TPA: hypothetical protein VEK15_01740 [Vicinamibacteria bacterium]|nr:hypothetical protein [Vicinamibacteria bacterium]